MEWSGGKFASTPSDSTTFPKPHVEGLPSFPAIAAARTTAERESAVATWLRDALWEVDHHVDVYVDQGKRATRGLKGRRLSARDRAYYEECRVTLEQMRDSCKLDVAREAQRLRELPISAD